MAQKSDSNGCIKVTRVIMIGVIREEKALDMRLCSCSSDPSFTCRWVVGYIRKVLDFYGLYKGTACAAFAAWRSLCCWIAYQYSCVSITEGDDSGLTRVNRFERLHCVSNNTLHSDTLITHCNTCCAASSVLAFSASKSAKVLELLWGVARVIEL